MSLTACFPGALMTWVPMRELAVKIDALAVTLQTPGYTRLVDIVDAPFQFTDKVPAPQGFHQTFYLNGRMVASRLMTSDKQGNSAYSLPQSNLSYLADLDELFYVADEDDCLCKTIYKVERAGSGFTLATTDGSGCCQGLPVPEVNENITAVEQHLLPHGLITQYLGTDYSECCGCCVPMGLSDMLACTNGGQAYALTAQDPAHPECLYITRLSRKISSGYFTWPFKKRYLDLIIEKLNFILECAKNDGIAPAGHGTPQDFEWSGSTTTLWVHGQLYASHGAPTFQSWFKTGSTCPTRTVDQWFASLWRESFYDKDAPGNLVFGEPPELVSSGKPDDGLLLKFTRPWEDPTGLNAESCDPPNLPKVYAYTLNSLDLLVEKLADRVWPYGTFDPPAAIQQCDDEDTVHCCGFPDINFSTSRVDCARVGGTPTSSYEACCSELQNECSTQQGSNCGEPLDCTWDSFLCSCSCPEVCVDAFKCCCGPSDVGASEVCKDPADPTDPSTCPEGCYPAISCSPYLDVRCCYADGSYAPNSSFQDGCPDDELGPTTPCYGLWYANCQGVPSSYPISYVVPPLLPPEYPDLPTCDKPCCLTHPVFLHGPKDCLQYFSEIEAFVLKATDGMFDNCRYMDLRYVDPENPETSAVRDCETIACGQVCQADYEILIASPEHPVITCLDQAPMMYSFDRRKVLHRDDSLLDYYDILITRPTTF